MSDVRSRRLYLVDFEPGQALDIPGSFEMTPQRVREFAAAYDPQPIHLDQEAARGEFFERLVASGWHGLAVTARLMVVARPLGDTPLIGASIDNLKFLAPILPTDVLRVEAEVLGTRVSRSRPERGFLCLRLVTRRQDGTAVLTQDWTLLLPARPS